jgi:hypothetical protein
MSKII